MLVGGWTATVRSNPGEREMSLQRHFSRDG